MELLASSTVASATVAMGADVLLRLARGTFGAATAATALVAETLGVFAFFLRGAILV